MKKGGYPCFYIDNRDIQNRRSRVAFAEPPYMPYSPVSVLELGATVFVWPPLYAAVAPLSLRALPAVYLGLGGYLPRLDLDFEGLLDAVALDFD